MTAVCQPCEEKKQYEHPKKHIHIQRGILHHGATVAGILQSIRNPAASHGTGRLGPRGIQPDILGQEPAMLGKCGGRIHIKCQALGIASSYNGPIDFD